MKRHQRPPLQTAPLAYADERQLARVFGDGMQSNSQHKLERLRARHITRESVLRDLLNTGKIPQ